MALGAGFKESDYRPSAIGTGTVAIAFMVSIAAIFLALDVMTLRRKVLEKKKKGKRKDKKRRRIIADEETSM